MIHEELERNLPNVTLDHIVKDLLSYFNGFEVLHEAKRRIEKICAIKKEPEHKCWSEEYIIEAWNELIQKKIKSSTRRHWARVIILQVVKSFVCDKCKQNTGQTNRHATAEEQGCETTPYSEDRIFQSKAKLETVGAAEGVEQMFGAGKRVSEVSTFPEDSGVASGSQLSAFSTDVAPSPTEENPIANSNNSENKNTALVNEDEDTSVNNCEEQKYVDNDVRSADVHDKENVPWENSPRSACDISQRTKGNSEDGSPQSNAEPQETEQTQEDYTPTKRKWPDKEGSESQHSTSGESDDSKDVPKRRNLKKNDDGSCTREGSRKCNSQTVYIRIPFSVMSGDESPSYIDTVVGNDSPTYKLIDRVPNLTEIRKRKSYAVLYNNQTRNAAWVYEILNSETLKEEAERPNDFSVDQSIHPFFQTSKDKYESPYERGHLAAARNHKWCRKACDDTFLMSNISPQHKNLNRGKWRQLEKKCRDRAKEANIRNVHVYSGPLYLPTDNNIKVVKYTEMVGKAVPSHFFKVIIVEHNDGKVELECFKVPNDSAVIEPEKVKIECIERDSGLIFRESSCSEGETETLIWTGENKHGGKCTATTHVHISTP